LGYFSIRRQIICLMMACLTLMRPPAGYANVESVEKDWLTFTDGRICPPEPGLRERNRSFREDRRDFFYRLVRLDGGGTRYGTRQTERSLRSPH